MNFRTKIGLFLLGLGLLAGHAGKLRAMNSDEEMAEGTWDLTCPENPEAMGAVNPGMAIAGGDYFRHVMMAEEIEEIDAENGDLLERAPSGSSWTGERPHSLPNRPLPAHATAVSAGRKVTVTVLSQVSQEGGSCSRHQTPKENSLIKVKTSERRSASERRNLAARHKKTNGLRTAEVVEGFVDDPETGEKIPVSLRVSRAVAEAAGVGESDSEEEEIVMDGSSSITLPSAPTRSNSPRDGDSRVGTSSSIPGSGNASVLSVDDIAAAFGRLSVVIPASMSAEILGVPASASTETLMDTEDQDDDF